jgi:acyl-CoA thioesterase
MTDVERALELRPTDGGWSAQVPAGWGQGRTTFGGLVAALLVRAAQAADSRPVRSVDVYFLEPVVTGPVELSVDSVRAGKYLTHLEIGLVQGNRRAAVGRFLLGEWTSGRFDQVPAAPTPEKSFDECLEMPYLEGLTPEFTRNLQVRVGEGDLPMTGSKRAVTGGFVRNRGAARGPAALLTHMDAWPPPVLALLDKPAAASSIRWHVQFHADVTEADGGDWSWFRCEADWRSGSLSTVAGMLVRGGTPVAYSEQTVAMYG